MENTTLHWSIKKNQFDVSLLLIENGAFVNAKNIFLQTPLFFAI